MNIAVLIYHDVQDFEVSSALTIFKTTARFMTNPPEIFTIHRTRASILGSSGLVMTPNYAVTSAPNPDILVIPGGAGIEKLYKDAITKEYLVTHAEKVKHLILGTNAALLLGEYGMLENKSITAFPSLLETLWKYNPSEVLPERIVTDRHWKSISRSAAMLEVCLAVAEIEFGVTEEVKTHLGLEMP